MAAREWQRRLVAAVQEGFPLCPRPYQVIAERAGLTEEQVLAGLAELHQRGVIRRLGVVVRHHELGYRANAMVVWQLPPERVAEVGEQLRTFDFVTLCYRRRPALPAWPFNLYCMIHGRQQEEVVAQVEHLTRHCGLTGLPRRILFSTRRFKQCGAVYQRGEGRRNGAG